MHDGGGPRVLLVEDDRELAGMLSDLLTAESYRIDQAHDGQRGLHMGLTGRYDVMILDRRLPVVDGLTLLARLRTMAVTSRVLMLSARGEVADRVAGLDSGADDYLAKPFETDELLARVRALCRRDLDGADHLPLGTATIDVARRDVVLPDGERIGLTGREFALLHALARRPRVVHTRSSLQAAIFVGAGAAAVDTYVYYLRRKLGSAAVRTVHGLGYRIGAV